MNFFFGGSGLRDNRAGSGRRQPRDQQPLRGVFVTVARHVDDDSCIRRQRARPVVGRRGFCLGMMAGQYDQRGRYLTVSQRDFRGGGGCEGCGHAGNNFEVDASLSQRLNLFSGAAEQKRISTFQADNLQAKQRKLAEQRIDIFLKRALFSAPLANGAKLSGFWHQSQDFRSNQLIVQDHIRRFELPQRFQRKQLGIARPRAHQKYFPLHRMSPLPSGVAAKASRLASSWRSLRRASGSRPLEKSRSRALPSCSTHSAYSGPNCSSSSWRRRWASAGL